MLSLNYFIHSSWQLHYYYSALGMDHTLRLLLAEMGFELDCLAPKYSALTIFPFCSPTAEPWLQGSHLQRRRMRSGNVRAQTKCFTALAHFIFTTSLRGGFPNPEQKDREPGKGGVAHHGFVGGNGSFGGRAGLTPTSPSFQPLGDFPNL